MNKTPRTTALAACVITALALPPAFADQPSEEAGPNQHLGFGGGALLGALAGGPPGLILGAFGGALLGRAQDQDEALAAREQELQDSRRQVADLQRSLQGQHLKVAAEQRRADGLQAAQAAAAVARGFSYTVQFRTDSATLEPHYRQHLSQLAGALAMFDNLTVQLAGHADPRGSDRHNLALSRDRVLAVRGQLLKAGVPAVRIVHSAHGEQGAMATAADREAMFFDRRVQITFRFDDGGLPVPDGPEPSLVYQPSQDVQP